MALERKKLTVSEKIEIIHEFEKNATVQGSVLCGFIIRSDLTVC
jgi:hypothetical protein